MSIFLLYFLRPKYEVMFYDFFPFSNSCIRSYTCSVVPIVQGSCSLHGQAEVIGSLNPDPFAHRLIAMLEVEVT